MLALAGDSSDNIKGVPGIGMKTASMLVSKFGGSVDNIYSNLEHVPGKKRKESLAMHQDDVNLAYELVRLEDNAPLSCISVLCSVKDEDGASEENMSSDYGINLDTILNDSKVPSLLCESTRKAIEKFCDCYHI